MVSFQSFESELVDSLLSYWYNICICFQFKLWLFRRGGVLFSSLKLPLSNTSGSLMVIISVIYNYFYYLCELLHYIFLLVNLLIIFLILMICFTFQVGDRLFSAFGQDVLDALLWTSTGHRSQSQHFGTLPHLLLSIVYVCILLFHPTSIFPLMLYE